jgi:uncharacterized membrane protein
VLRQEGSSKSIYKLEVVMNKKKEMITGAVFSGIVCFIASFVVGGFLAPLPANAIANAVGNGLSGLLSGAITAIVTTVLLFKKFENTRSTPPKEG